MNMFNNLTLAGKAVPLAEDTSDAFITAEGRNTFDDLIAFNNRTSAGALEPLFEDTGSLSGFRQNSGLDDTVEDGLMLSLL